MSYSLNPCPMCGSPAKLDSTAAAECYGKAWQTMYIECTMTNDPHCGMEVIIQADFGYVEGAALSLVNFWNSLGHNK